MDRLTMRMRIKSSENQLLSWETLQNGLKRSTLALTQLQVHRTTKPLGTTNNLTNLPSSTTANWWGCSRRLIKKQRSNWIRVEAGQTHHLRLWSRMWWPIWSSTLRYESSCRKRRDLQKRDTLWWLFNRGRRSNWRGSKSVRKGEITASEKEMQVEERLSWSGLRVTVDGIWSHNSLLR